MAEALRRELPADAVRIWFREAGTTAFHAAQAPPAPDGPPPAASLVAIPAQSGWHRSWLEHEATRLGLLEARAGAPALELLTIVADILAPYLAAVELSSDLAGEVAAQSREIEEHRRFTSLIVDSLPLGLYVVDRDYRIQSWNRKRETGTQGLRRDDVVGRPVFEVLTRQPAGAAPRGVRPGVRDRRDPAEPSRKSRSAARRATSGSARSRCGSTATRSRT